MGGGKPTVRENLRDISTSSGSSPLRMAMLTRFQYTPCTMVNSERSELSRLENYTRVVACELDLLKHPLFLWNRLPSPPHHHKARITLYLCTGFLRALESYYDYAKSSSVIYLWWRPSSCRIAASISTSNRSNHQCGLVRYNLVRLIFIITECSNYTSQLSELNI